MKKDFTFKIYGKGCNVVIENGAAGTFTIPQASIALAGNCHKPDVCCATEDENKPVFIDVFDLMKARTGFQYPVIALNPADFNMTASELETAIAVAAGRPVKLSCCINQAQLALDASVDCDNENAEPVQNCKEFQFAEQNQDNTLFAVLTDVGTIGVPANINDSGEAVAAFINGWIADNNLQGTATATTNGLAFNNCNFNVIAFQQTTTLPFIDCSNTENKTHQKVW